MMGECDLEVIGVPSIFKLISKTAALVRMLTTFDLSSEENVSRRWWNWPLVDSGSCLLLIDKARAKDKTYT